MPIAAGAAVWSLMCVAYAPTLRLYGLSPLWGLALPASALLYTLMTVDSARRHRNGRGTEWRGRLTGGLCPDNGFEERSSALPSMQGGSCAAKVQYP